jgi:hypothetical protein
MNRNFEKEEELIEKLNGPTNVKDEVLSLKISNPRSFKDYLKGDHIDLNESSLLIMEYMDKEVFSKIPEKKVISFFHDFMFLADDEFNKAYKETVELREKYSRIVEDITNNLLD